MLAGQYRHQVDYKGRVSVPKKLRAELVGGGVVTRGLDGCLFLYSKASWDVLSKKLLKLPLTGRDARAFSRYIFANAQVVTYDRLGRITLPPYLIEFAKIKSDVVFVGVGDRAEIWSESAWKIYQEQTEKESSQVAEKLTETGI
jgi:MraZ protein